jgi:hypothetical protein
MLKIKQSIIIIIIIQIFSYLIAYGMYEMGMINTPFVLIGVLLDFFLVLMLLNESMKKISPIIFCIYGFSTVFLLLMFTLLYQNTGVSIGDNYIVKDFYSCFYFSVITWTSLGYGDIFPTKESRVWVMLEVFFGYLHMGVLVGLLLEYLSKNKS